MYSYYGRPQEAHSSRGHVFRTRKVFWHNRGWGMRRRPLCPFVDWRLRLNNSHSQHRLGTLQYVSLFPLLHLYIETWCLLKKEKILKYMYF